MHKNTIRKCSPSRIPINLELLPIIDLCISKPEIHINNNAECQPTCENNKCDQCKYSHHKHQCKYSHHKEKHRKEKHRKEKHCKHKNSKKKCKCHNDNNLYETSSDSSLVVF